MKTARWIIVGTHADHYNQSYRYSTFNDDLGGSGSNPRMSHRKSLGEVCSDQNKSMSPHARVPLILGDQSFEDHDRVTPALL